VGTGIRSIRSFTLSFGKDAKFRRKKRGESSEFPEIGRGEKKGEVPRAFKGRTESCSAVSVHLAGEKGVMPARKRTGKKNSPKGGKRGEREGG